MKIVRKDKYSVCEFGELKVGDVFIENVDGREFLQMKTHEVDSDKTYNAVSLDTGEPYEIEANTEVRRVHAELIITNVEEA
jgi:hypothetical protein